MGTANDDQITEFQAVIYVAQLTDYMSVHRDE